MSDAQNPHLLSEYDPGLTKPLPGFWGSRWSSFGLWKCGSFWPFGAYESSCRVCQNGKNRKKSLFGHFRKKVDFSRFSKKSILAILAIFRRLHLRRVLSVWAENCVRALSCPKELPKKFSAQTDSTRRRWSIGKIAKIDFFRNLEIWWWRRYSAKPYDTSGYRRRICSTRSRLSSGRCLIVWKGARRGEEGTRRYRSENWRN